MPYYSLMMTVDGLVINRKYLRYIAACVKIQSYVRMWSDRRAFIFLRQTAVRIQASARMLLAKWKYQLWKRKAIGE